jgi:hypothetical protein
VLLGVSGSAGTSAGAAAAAAAALPPSALVRHFVHSALQQERAQVLAEVAAAPVAAR